MQNRFPVESRCAAVLLDSPQIEPEGLQTSNEIPNWYFESRQDLRLAIARLEEIHEDWEENHVVRDEWKAELDRRFTPHFYDDLAVWSTMSDEDIYFADFIKAHGKTYGSLVPPIDKSLVGCVVIDPLQGQQMVSKLINFQLRHMQDSLRFLQLKSESDTAANPRPTDYAPRYYSAAIRDLHRNVEWYWTLKRWE